MAALCVGAPYYWGATPSCMTLKLTSIPSLWRERACAFQTTMAISKYRAVSVSTLLLHAVLVCCLWHFAGVSSSSLYWVVVAGAAVVEGRREAALACAVCAIPDWSPAQRWCAA